jgi:hypothetical protein
MGIGAAASEPGTLSIIRHMFPDRRERARAVGKGAGTGPRPFESSPLTNDPDVLRVVSRAAHANDLHFALEMLVKAT